MNWESEGVSGAQLLGMVFIVGGGFAVGSWGDLLGLVFVGIGAVLCWVG